MNTQDHDAAAVFPPPRDRTDTTAASQVLVAIGPMFSSKTSTLLRYLKDAKRAGFRVLAVKPAIDKRYGADEIVTHADERMPCLQVSALSEIAPTEYDVIGVDEGQFLPDLPDFCAEVLRKHRGKTVIVSMLRSDFRAEPWDPTSRVVALATDVAVLKANCDACGAIGQAVYTERRAAENTTKIVVGGAEKYFAACPHCYFWGQDAAAHS